jgi:hypothetical protein
VEVDDDAHEDEVCVCVHVCASGVHHDDDDVMCRCMRLHYSRALCYTGVWCN